jgi:hypothetical protein
MDHPRISEHHQEIDPAPAGSMRRLVCQAAAASAFRERRRRAPPTIPIPPIIIAQVAGSGTELA